MKDAKIEEMVKLAGSVLKPNPEWDKLNRQDINIRIIQILDLASKAWPSLRFGQILRYFELDMKTFDPNEESRFTLSKMLATDAYQELQKAFPDEK